MPRKRGYKWLDNLKLGYGGTREEMKRLLADAEKLTGVHYDINNLDDVFKAIHAIQVEMGFTGTTAKEAAGTVEGSYNSMKGAWENFLTALGTGNSQKIRKTTEELCDSIVANFRNILPVIGNIFEGIGQVIEEYTGLPVNDLFKGIVGLINSSVIPAVKNLTGFIRENKDEMQNLIPVLAAVLSGIMAYKAIKKLSPAITILTDLVGAMKAAGGLSTIGDLTAGFELLIESVTGASLSVGAFMSVFAPVAMVVGAVAISVKSYHDQQAMANEITDNAVGKADNLANSAKNLRKEVNDLKDQTSEIVGNAKANASVANDLNDRLQNLISTSGTTKEGQKEIAKVVDELNQKVPDLNLAYDAQTNSLNKSNKEIKDHINNMVKEAEMQATVESLTEAYKTQNKIQEKKAKVEQQIRSNRAMDEELNEAESAFMKDGGWAKHGAELTKISNARDKLTEANKKNNKTLKSLNASSNENKNEIKAYKMVAEGSAKDIEDAYKKLGVSTKGTGEQAAKNLGVPPSEYEKLKESGRQAAKRVRDGANEKMQEKRTGPGLGEALADWFTGTGLYKKGSDLATQLKNGFQSINFGDMWSAITGRWDGVKTSWSNKWTEIGNAAQGFVDGLRNRFNFDWRLPQIHLPSFSDIQKRVSGFVGSVRSYFHFNWGLPQVHLPNFDDIANGVKGFVHRIRSYFNFNWHLPDIKVPDIHIKGKFSLNPPQAPHFSVSWHAKAMDNPYMFTNATLFGAGEAGDEIMYGRQALMRDIKEAVGNQDIVGIVQALNAIALAIEEIAAIFSQIVSSGTNSGSASAIGTQAPQGSSMQTAASNTYGVLADQAQTATQSAQTDIATSMALQVADIQNTAPLMQIAAQAVYSPISQNAINATGQAKNTVLTNMQMMAIFIASLLGQFQASSYSTFNAVALSATDRTNAAKSSTQTIIIALEGWIRGQYSAFYALGVYTMQGYNNGLLAEKATVVGTTNQLVDAVKEAFRTGLGIASPSKVAFAYGRYTGIGFINGLNSTELGKFTRSTVSDMKGAFAKQKFSADANVNYMDDDSMKEVNWMRKYDGGSIVGGSGDGRLGRFVSNMLSLVNNDSHGYSQSNRWGPDFDCSSSIIYSLRKAGFDTGSATSTHNLSANLTARGWSRLPYANPKRGDILLNDATHVELALGGLINAGFHSAHGHPEPGDQAHEAYVGRDPGHWAAILRYKNGLGNSLADAIEEAYNFKKYGFGTMDAEGDDGGAAASGNLSDWVRAALKLTGQSESLASGLIRAAKAESGGNPRAVNGWDINAKLGHPSKGLMQTIDSTFNAYKLPGHGNIWNPIDNMVAAIRYMIARYGSVERVLKPRSKHWYGYAVGSRFISRDQFAKIHAGEAVIRKSENPYANSRGGFVTTALQEGINAVMSDFANKVAVTAAGGMTTVTNNNDMTQNVYFQETPKQPSAFRAELRQAGRSLAFNGN